MNLIKETFMRILICSALSALLAAAQPAGNTPKGLDHDTFFEMESVASPAISPDGALIVFSRSWADKMKDQQRSNLWLVDKSGQRLRHLTPGNWRDSAPVWSPDGKRIAFLSDRDGTTQLHVMWIDTREVAQLTHLERAPGNVKWSPDGKQLAYTVRVPDEDPILPIKLPKRPEGAQWAKPAVLVDRLSWRSDGVGPTERGFTHVFLIDAITGGTPRQLTNGKFNHSQFEWAPDGKTIYLSGIRKPDAEYLRNDSEIYAVDLASGAIKALTDRKGPDTDPQPSPNGRWIAYTGYDDQKFTNHVGSLYVMDTAGNSKKVWATGLPSRPADVSWAPDNSGVYYSMEERGTENLYFVALDGKPRQVTDGVHMLRSFSMASNGQTAAIRSTYHEPTVLVTFDVKRPGASLAKLVDVNTDILQGRKLGDVEELSFASKDGLKVQGWLVKPVNFDSKRKYPMLLFIHGGPWSMYNVAFNWAWQNFAAQGYAVLYINPRGSTGYGQEFVNGIQYSYPGKDYEDLMAGVDAALAKGYIDDQNLFVCGGSGGGVLTAWIVGHTNRFRAAVSMRPVINWHSFVGNTDGPSWYDQFQKRPWEDPMEYAVRSPLHYVANVTTPTMVMTGEADLRTPIGQSEEFYRALKLLKKDTLLVRMPEEFHGWRRPSHQLAQQLYLQAWFEKWRVKKPEGASSGQ
ncbi:MAG: S9 family peptidase [Acidobacteria bacterium]|nr:S9 family peptidase [Acidobacteriota bacterium]